MSGFARFLGWARRYYSIRGAGSGFNLGQGGAVQGKPAGQLLGREQKKVPRAGFEPTPSRPGLTWRRDQLGLRRLLGPEHTSTHEHTTTAQPSLTTSYEIASNPSRETQGPALLGASPSYPAHRNTQG